MPCFHFGKQIDSSMSLESQSCTATKCMQLFGNSLAQTNADVINSTSIIISYRCRLWKFDLQSVTHQTWWVVCLGERRPLLQIAQGHMLLNKVKNVATKCEANNCWSNIPGFVFKEMANEKAMQKFDPLTQNMFHCVIVCHLYIWAVCTDQFTYRVNAINVKVVS